MKLKKDKKFNKSLTKTLTSVFVFTVLFTIISLSTVFYFQTKQTLITSLGNKALDVAKLSAEKIDVDEVEQFSAVDDMGKKSYKDLGMTLNHIREISGAKYLYVMRQNEKGEYVYIIESADYNSDEPTLIGEVEKNYPGFEIVMKGEPYIEDYISVDEYGALISAYYPLKDESGQVIGFVGLDYEVNAAHNSFKEFQKRMILMSISLCVIVMLLAYFISRYISKPVKQATIISEKVANYNLDTYHIDIKNKDEIGRLAHSINHMIDSLKEIVIKVRNSSETLKESTSKLTFMTDESTQAVESITLSINEIATGSENTSSNIIELNNTISGFSKSLQQTVDNTQKANEVSNEMKLSAYKGEEAVTNIIDKINLINQSTDNTSNVIGELDDKVQNINDIVQVINNISEQTNLLALNANIEAARAGDAGRGFAVVAEEVRKLAEETQSYSKEITSVINSIIDNTKNAVDSMSNVKSIVSDSITTANVTKGIFSDLLIKINETSRLVDNITRASEEQADNANDILEMINSVSAISEETSSTCQNSVSLAEETLASIEEITALTENLNHIAVSLNQIVSKFNI